MLAIALSPVILSWLAKKHFKGKNYSRSGVAGFLSTLLAILTGATGLVSVTQNCFECLMVSLSSINNDSIVYTVLVFIVLYLKFQACVGLAIIFCISSFFFIFYNFLSCGKELGSNCCAMILCQCCSKLQGQIIKSGFFNSENLYQATDGSKILIFEIPNTY